MDAIKRHGLVANNVTIFARAAGLVSDGGDVSAVNALDLAAMLGLHLTGLEQGFEMCSDGGFMIGMHVPESPTKLRLIVTEYLDALYVEVHGELRLTAPYERIAVLKWCGEEASITLFPNSLERRFEEIPARLARDLATGIRPMRQVMAAVIQSRLPDECAEVFRKEVVSAFLEP